MGDKIPLQSYRLCCKYAKVPDRPEPHQQREPRVYAEGAKQRKDSSDVIYTECIDDPWALMEFCRDQTPGSLGIQGG